jgi:hypothetical protein
VKIKQQKLIKAAKHKKNVLVASGGAYAYFGRKQGEVWFAADINVCCKSWQCKKYHSTSESYQSANTFIAKCSTVSLQSTGNLHF